MGVKRLIGEAMGDMGLWRMLFSSDTLVRSSFHHLLSLCTPVSVRVESLVPKGLVIWPSQYMPCFLSVSRADEKAVGVNIVWSDLSEYRLPGLVILPCVSEMVAECLCSIIPIRAHQCVFQ